jgi:hypothetical protein
MSQSEDPRRLQRSRERGTTVEDVRELTGAATPHFALQLRGRIAKLIADLPPDDPARTEGEREIARLERLGFAGETRGEGVPRPGPAGETNEKGWKMHVLASVTPERLLD